jgi:hypothetical protein
VDGMCVKGVDCGIHKEDVGCGVFWDLGHWDRAWGNGII